MNNYYISVYPKIIKIKKFKQKYLDFPNIVYSVCSKSKIVGPF